MYGGPYCAVVLVPPSSATAVAVKSFGVAADQVARVIGFSSGEENSAARPAVSTATATSAMVNSLSRSYGRVGNAAGSGSATR